MTTTPKIQKLVRDGRATSHDAALLIELRRLELDWKRAAFRSFRDFMASWGKRLVAVKK